MPFRALQPLIDTLLKHHPEKARTERERDQADEIYSSGQNIRVSNPVTFDPFVC
jgi:E3 ubiquitin-protein ligase CHFR